MAKMNIRETARWAERNDALFTVGRDGQPNYLYAVYRITDNIVECIGGYEKCSTYEAEQRAAGGLLRMERLQDVVSDMDEEAGEASCQPDLCEQREWA